MTAQTKLPILIAGAGIAGLSCALAMANRGYTVLVFEKSPQISEVGAGLQLAPNATLLLQRLGVLQYLLPSSVQPDAILLKDGRSNDILTRMELGNAPSESKNLPYLVCHRADLQKALLLACAKHANIKIGLNAKVLNYKTHEDHITTTVMLKSGIKTFTGSLLIGCDGVWSAISPNRPVAKFSNFIAWRATLKTNQLAPELAQSKNVTAWLGSNAHLVSYPISAGDQHNFVAITHGTNNHPSWNESGRKDNLLKSFDNWNPAIRKVLDTAHDWTYWPLYEMDEPYYRAGQRTILLGDAAHALTPFAAQGAAMAIEDACALAEALTLCDTSSNKQLNHALETFNSIRASRIHRVAKRGRLNRFAYHANGPAALARNAVFKMRSPKSFLKDLNWLYAYDAEAAIRKTIKPD